MSHPSTSELLAPGHDEALARTMLKHALTRAFASG